MENIKVVGVGKLILHGGKRIVLAVLICLAVFTMASSVFVGLVHAEGYIFVLKWGSYGFGDGQFNGPWGVAVDGSGNVYVVEFSNSRVQKFTSTGTFRTKWGSKGSDDGQFDYPSGVAVDGSENVYVADTGNHRVQKFTSTGDFITKWGSQGSGDSQFNGPCGVAVDGSGNVYIADTFNHRVQKFTSTGSFITKWGSQGSDDGQFDYPSGVAVDGSGNVYVAENRNHRVQKFTLDATPPTTAISKSGTAGDNNWFTSNVTVTLTPSDTQSAVAQTKYTLDGGTTWLTYTSPITITTEGNTTIQYYSVDSVANQENIKSENIKIDKAIPEGSVTINEGATYTNSPSVTLTLSAQDTTLGSGVAQMCFSNDSVTWSSWEAYATSKAWTLTSGDGTKTVCYRIKDNAGLNSTIKSDTILLDTSPPTGSITIAEGATYTNSLSVILTVSADDTTSGVAQTRFSNDNITWSNWETYATSKTWTLTTGDGTKTVYVEFRDNAGCTCSYQHSITLDTLPPSIALTTSLNNGTEIKSSTYEISWIATDLGLGVDHYEVSLDTGTWSNIGNTPTYTFTGLSDGTHTFNIKAIDKTGKSQIFSVNVAINTSPIGGPGYFDEALLGLAIAIGTAGVGAVTYKMIKRPKKPPGPTQLRVIAEPARIIADGESKSTITIHLLDKKGQPITASTDTQVKIATTKGKLEKPTVTIPKGKDTEKTVIISSTESGPVTVSASAEGLRSIGITLNFIEKKRFCMHCGFLIPFKAKTCSNCGKAPPAGVDTKTCKNCKSTIPAAAKFCSECGAGQVE